MNMDFFNWNTLGTSAGAVTAVAIMTQLTKGVKQIEKLPTQLWSYILALVVLVLTQIFGDECTVQGIVLCIFNAAVVSLAANGGYEAVTRFVSGRGIEE